METKKVDAKSQGRKEARFKDHTILSKGKRMKKLSLSLLAILFCNFFTGNVIAQSDKVLLLIAPKPNQTSRHTMTQEMVMDLTFDGEVPEPLAAMKTMKMEMKLILGLVQKNGPVDKDGRLEAEITFDQASSEMTIGGNPLPFGEGMNKFIGKRSKLIFDSKGEVMDMSLPDGVSISREALKQMLQSVYGNWPKEPLSIGETAILPLNIDFPIPMLGAAPIKFDGQVKTKLVALDTTTEGRIAKLDRTTETKIINTMNLDSPSGKLTMNIDIKLNGGGTSQIIIDKGLVKASEMKMTLDGKIGITADFQLPDMLLKGTIKVTVVGTN
jgi:hypothetical protein